MSTTPQAALETRANQVHDRYRREFAGRSRIGRDAAILDGLVAELQQILVEGQSLQSSESFRNSINERIELYRRERIAIAEAQAGGPDVALAYRLHDWSWMDARRYARHFAGHNRVTRDLGLMQEMLAGERSRLAKLEETARRHDDNWRSESIEAMKKGIELYSREAQAIAETRAGLPAPQKVQALAGAANDQFKLYREHFQGKARNTRNAQLLERIIVQLSEILAGMESVQKAGHHSDANTGNIDKVRSRLTHHRAELSKVKQARSSMQAAQLAAALGEEANGLFREYRASFAGRPRQEADVEKLSQLCDQIFSVAQAMDALHQSSAVDIAEKNLAITLDNLKAYEREWSRIHEAQRGTV